jgi:hypothetical protein
MANERTEARRRERSARATLSGHLRVLVTMISLDEAVGTIVKTFPRAGRAILQRAVTI